MKIQLPPRLIKLAREFEALSCDRNLTNNERYNLGNSLAVRMASSLAAIVVVEDERAANITTKKVA